MSSQAESRRGMRALCTQDVLEVGFAVMLSSGAVPGCTKTGRPSGGGCSAEEHRQSLKVQTLIGAMHFGPPAHRRMPMPAGLSLSLLSAGHTTQPHHPSW